MKKKLLTGIMAAALALSMTACGGAGAAGSSAAGSSAAGSSAASGSGAAAGGKTYKIGICNYVDDASLNQICENIQNQLNKVGQEKGVTFDVKLENCNADANVLAQIVTNFKADKKDLLIGVATPVAMEMQAATEDTDIPVVFAAVSDPISTKLVASMDKPGKNITGTSDALDTANIFKLMTTVNKNVKKVGLLYDAGQDASTTAIKDAKKYLDDNKIAYVEKTGTNADEVKLAAQALVSEKVDAVFTPTDNTIMAAELSIYEIFKEAKIPHYCGADSFALNGAFLGYGVDYANLGVETANMAADILINNKKPADTAVKTFDNGTATINTEICEALSLDFKKLQEELAPMCTKVQEIKTAKSFN